MADLHQNTDYFLLCEAIEMKDTMISCFLIKNNVDVNISGEESDTPLHRAIIKFKDVHIMTMLLDRGANVYAKNRQNLRPLDVAIQNNKTEAAILLINKGALFGADLNELLLKTIENYNYTVFKRLINHGIQYNTSIAFNTLFNATISRGHLQMIEYILPHCGFLETSDKYIPREVVIRTGQEYIECVEFLLRQNFIIKPKSNRDKYFVYGAVENGHLQIVLQLLKLGIDVNLINSKTRLNLLKIACINKHHEIVENLLKHNASVNETIPTNIELLKNLSCNYYNRYRYDPSLSSVHNKSDLWGITCLHIAVLNSDPIMTRILLKYGAKIIDDPTFFNITCIAVRNNCEEIVRIFLDQGVDVNDVGPQGNTLLHFCINTSSNARDSRYNIAKLLLEKGAITSIQTPGNSLIFEAVTNGHHKIAQLFLDYNADIQYISLDGDTLLHKAIEKEFDVEFIKTLLKRNAPVNAVNNYLLTPLLVTVKIELRNQFEIIKALLEHNENVNCTVDCVNIHSTDDMLMKPIDAWNPNRNLIDCSLLRGRGLYFDSKKNKGKTPLHFICTYKSDMTESIIKLLLKHNANIEAIDRKGWTPLFDACNSNNDIAVKCLLENNANADRTDLQNLTPFYFAAKHCGSNSEIVQMLLDYKINVHCIDKHGKSMIHIFIVNCYAKIIKSLFHTQLDFNSVNKEGNTPLHFAVRCKRIDMVKSLIKYGANINTLDKNNQTPLQNAIEYMHKLQNHFLKFQRRRCTTQKYSEDEGWNTDTFEDELIEYKEIINILKMHVVKLKAAGLKVNDQNLKIVYNSNAYSDNELVNDEDINSERINMPQFEIQCEQEIETMRMESIGVNNMTLYDLLEKDIYFLSRYVKNKKILQTLDLAVNNKKFPLYIDIVKSRFRDAKFRCRLMNTVKKYFSIYVCPRLTDFCIDTVFSYLNMKDINIFISAMKPCVDNSIPKVS